MYGFRVTRGSDGYWYLAAKETQNGTHKDCFRSQDFERITSVMFRMQGKDA